MPREGIFGLFLFLLGLFIPANPLRNQFFFYQLEFGFRLRSDKNLTFCTKIFSKRRELNLIIEFIILKLT